MSTMSDDLRQEALALSESERAELAAELLSSLENSPLVNDNDVDAQWVTEIERRAQRALAGDASTQDWEAVRQRISGAHPE